MASYHFTIKSSNDTQASANMRADYICREGKFAYGTKAEDLLYKEHGNLPEWAEGNHQTFWRASEEYEKAANRTSFREIEFALPNELNLDQQKELVKEFVDKHYGKDFVYSYAIHSKAASLAQGVQNPHVHIVFSERKLDGIVRDKSIFFKRADKKCPARGGAAKDARWNGTNRKGYLFTMREDCAKLQNRYLEREGFSVRVDHRSKDDQFISAIKEGNLDKAQLLDAPAEVHLGPKQSSRVARDLASLTAGVTDVRERNALRRQYWESRRNSAEVYQLRQLRVLNGTVNEMQQLDKKRGPAREANADEIAQKMFWRTKSKEANLLRSKLDLEKYRLEKAQANRSTTAKVDAWRSFYEKRVQEWDTLKKKIENKTLTPEDLLEIKKLSVNIKEHEIEKRQRLEEEKQVDFTVAKKMVAAMPPGVAKQMAAGRIAEINEQLANLRKREIAVSKKVRSDVQIRLIAEWRLNKSLLLSMKRDERQLRENRRKYKQAYALFKRSIPPSATKETQDKEVEKEKLRLMQWKKEIDQLAGSLADKRKQLMVEKEKPEYQEEFRQIQNKWIARNLTIKGTLEKIHVEKEQLKLERSEWRRVEYLLQQPGGHHLNQVMKKSRSVQTHLQKAVSHLQQDRASGHMSVRLHTKDEMAKKRSNGHELE